MEMVSGVSFEEIFEQNLRIVQYYRRERTASIGTSLPPLWYWRKPKVDKGYLFSYFDLILRMLVENKVR
ncbi:hypothetical protein VBD025_06825 [Virgibacillus flavescens]|uniref:hypothetical protein n=1 Tax=Virgibacillus flavescens TaxID=1611422 RepID=UPI003D3374A2